MQQQIAAFVLVAVFGGLAALMGSGAKSCFTYDPFDSDRVQGRKPFTGAFYLLLAIGFAAAAVYWLTKGLNLRWR